MKTSVCKAKGRNFQKDVVMKLRQKYLLDFDSVSDTDGVFILPKAKDDCYSGDITARMMGGAGTDIVLSPAAQKLIPWDIECKCQQSLNIWSALKQAEANSVKGRIPLLCFKRNHTEAYCCLKLDDFLRLLP
jgi:hypothetical protein